MSSQTVDDLLALARRGLSRLEPREASTAMAADGVLVDIRSESQRQRDGTVPGALFIPRNVLEWRCDPASPSRDGRVAGTDRQVILMCYEGYQSSLAAATLQQLGLDRATDVIGGFKAWQAAGLPIE